MFIDMEGCSVLGGVVLSIALSGSASVTLVVRFLCE